MEFNSLEYRFQPQGGMPYCGIQLAVKATPVLLMVRELGIGGCERDLTKLAKSLDRRRFEPHVGCFHAEGLRARELREAGVPIVRFPVRSFRSWSAIDGARRMGRYLREHDIQIVHAFDMPTDVFAVPVGKLYRAPVVIGSHLFHRELAPLFYRTTLPLVDLLADTVLVNSKAIERHLIEDLRIPARRAYLSYNGVETEVFHPRPGGRLPGAPLVIGSLCALREEKRMDLLLDAFAHAALEGVQLLIVGSGERLPALESQRHRLGLEKVCRFEPAQTEVADWFRSMDIFVLPSRSESFPNALLEAMACGCCAIGSRVGGIPELIEHGENGLLFDSGDAAQLADALTLVVRDEALRQRLSAEAARTARDRFSMAIATRRMQSLYESLLERARRGDPL